MLTAADSPSIAYRSLNSALSQEQCAANEAEYNHVGKDCLPHSNSSKQSCSEDLSLTLTAIGQRFPATEDGGQVSLSDSGTRRVSTMQFQGPSSD